MSCPIILVSGKRKNQSCNVAIVKGGTTCSLHKNKLIPIFSKEQIEKIKEMAEQGKYNVDEIAMTKGTESKEETFCKWYRLVEKNRSIKIVDGQLYLSDPFIDTKIENNFPRFTMKMCRSLVKLLDHDMLVQFKKDMNGIDQSDMKHLFIHYQFPITFQWDTKIVYTCFYQTLYK